MNKPSPPYLGLNLVFIVFALVPTPVIIIFYLANKQWTEAHKGTVYLIGVGIGLVISLIWRRKAVASYHFRVDTAGDQFLENGVKALGQKDFDAAIRWLGKSLESKRTDGALVSRGCAYMEKSEYDKALLDFSEAVRLCPSNNKPRLSQILFNRAVCHKRKGSTDLAIADAKKAIELNAANTEAARLLGQLSFR